MKLLEYLDGYKFYLLLICGIALWLGMILDWWTMEEVDELWGLLGLLGLGAGRSALKKLEQ